MVILLKEKLKNVRCIRLHLYRAFGLTIKSPISLPEMLQVEVENPDVEIVLGPVDAAEFAPESMEQRPFKWWQVVPSEERLLFGCNAGIYDITCGNKITIEVEPGTTQEMIRLFLLGSALGAIQIQRGRVPIHGGAIVAQGRAVIITGQQGAGKSTMTSALVGNGFKYLTDDVSSVEIEGGTITVNPAYPQRKLVRDACVQLGYDPETLPVVDAERDKFAIRDRKGWHDCPVPGGMILELVPVKEGESLHSEPIGGHAKLTFIMNNLYRLQMHVAGGSMPPHVFKKILTIAAGIDVYRVYVPRGITRIAAIAAELAEELALIP